MTGARMAARGSLTPQDDAERWQVAARLRREHPRWVVIWLSSPGVYRAYPLLRARRGTVLSGHTPDQLAAQMDQVEKGRR